MTCAFLAATNFNIHAGGYDGGKTAAMFMLLTNQKSQSLSLVSSQVVGSSSTSKLPLPQKLDRGTYGGYGTEASTTPYQVIWSYSPDGGNTLLNFNCSLVGATGITITPTKTGPDAANWGLAEGHPAWTRERGWYASITPDGLVENTGEHTTVAKSQSIFESARFFVSSILGSRQ